MKAESNCQLQVRYRVVDHEQFHTFLSMTQTPCFYLAETNTPKGTEEIVMRQKNPIKLQQEKCLLVCLADFGKHAIDLLTLIINAHVNRLKMPMHVELSHSIASEPSKCAAVKSSIHSPHS